MASELTAKIQPSELKKPGFCMIRSMPCRITEIEHIRPATSNGNKRVRVAGTHVFTGKKYEDTLNLTAGFHGIDVPLTTKAVYSLMDVDAGTGFLSLLTDSGEAKEDTALSRADGGKTWDEIGVELVRRFDAGEALKVAVLTIMEKDIVVEVTKDTDA